MRDLTLAEVIVAHFADRNFTDDGLHDFDESPRTIVDGIPLEPEIPIDWDLTNIEPTMVMDLDDLMDLRLLSQVRQNGEPPCRHLPIREDDDED